MSTASAAAALATGMLYRMTDSRRLAASLVRRASAEDENTATVAKMMLVRDSAVPEVAAAVADGRPDLVDVLVSIGTPAARAALEELRADPDPSVTEAVLEGLRLLDRADERREDG